MNPIYLNYLKLRETIQFPKRDITLPPVERVPDFKPKKGSRSKYDRKK
jgi:hypothetical protein